MSQPKQRRLHWTLIASLVLHALLLAVMLVRNASGPAAVAKQKPLEIELVLVEPKAEAVVAPAPAPVAPPQVKPSPVRLAAKRPVATASAPEPAAVAEASAPSAPVGAPADSPRAGSPFLVPRVGTVLPGLGAGDDSEAAGHTVRNGPGEEPDVAAVNEYTAERSKVKLDDVLGEMVATAQRNSGLVDPYFTRLGADLAEGFKGAKVQLSKQTSAETFKQEVVDTYVAPAERFAKTGNPMGDPEQARQFNESSFGRTLERGGSQLGDPHDQRMLEAGMQTMAFSQIIKDQVSRPRLKTVMMLRQDGDGALAEATVLEHSGDNEFDEFVIHQARKVVRDQGDTSEAGGAPSAFGWSSVWQFTWEPPQVKVKLLRVLRGHKDSVLQKAQ